MMTVGRFEVSVLRSSLPAVIQSFKLTPVATRKKTTPLSIILGFHAFILVFYFHLVNCVLFLGKLTTGRPWPTANPAFFPYPLSDILSSEPPLKCPSSGGGGFISHLFFSCCPLFINLVISLFVYLVIYLF